MQTEEIKTISQLDNEEYTLITTDIEVKDILDQLGVDPVNRPVGLLVKEKNGELVEIWAFTGVPYLWRTAYRIK
jgi:enhancing lycopene biosynthesis protein 2